VYWRCGGPAGQVSPLCWLGAASSVPPTDAGRTAQVGWRGSCAALLAEDRCGVEGSCGVASSFRPRRATTCVLLTDRVATSFLLGLTAIAAQLSVRASRRPAAEPGLVSRRFRHAPTASSCRGSRAPGAGLRGLLAGSSLEVFASSWGGGGGRGMTATPAALDRFSLAGRSIRRSGPRLMFVGRWHCRAGQLIGNLALVGGPVCATSGLVHSRGPPWCAAGPRKRNPTT